MTLAAPVLPAVLHSADVLLDREIPPPDFVIKPFFPRGELTEIVGAHGNFKSTIALDACLSVATGRPWAGVATRQGRSVFITLEDSSWTLARRAKAWLRGIYDVAELDAAECSIRQNFAYLTREGSRGLVLTATSDGATTSRIEVADHLARLIDGASLVVLETVSRLHDGPETNEAFAALVRSLERVAATGAAVAVVRHMSKKAAREMTNPDAVDSYAGRGGAALSDAARSCLIVTRTPGDALGPITLKAAKTTHAKSGDTVSWTPVVEPDLEAVRLELRPADLQAVQEAEQVLAHLRAAGERGVTSSGLHKHPPAGLGRDAARRGLAYLRSTGQVVPRQEQRGSNKCVEVYYAPGVTR